MSKHRQTNSYAFVFMDYEIIIIIIIGIIRKILLTIETQQYMKTINELESLNLLGNKNLFSNHYIYEIYSIHCIHCI